MTEPGAPQVGLMRIDQAEWTSAAEVHAHAHDFLVIAYFERGGGALKLGNNQLQIESGDVYVIAPGEVVAVAGESGRNEAEGWGIFFPAETLSPGAPTPLLSWSAHPLLAPFAWGPAGGARRLHVSGRERSAWSTRFRALDRELRQRRHGYQKAVLAHLTLLLVDVSRLVAGVAGELRFKDDPLLADVFRIIEERFGDPISLKDVAWAMSLTPAYLTTVVRRKAGRTVQEWIVERRLSEARRLLVETDLSVAEVGRRVGYGSAGYFVRMFRRAHSITPVAWRRAGRA